VLGGGLGVTVAWVNSAGRLVQEFTADTPVLLLAKFGILGLLLVGILVWATFRTIQDLLAGGAATRTARLSIIGFAAALVALTPFGWQLEDKGTGLATILLLGLALASAREAGLASANHAGPRRRTGDRPIPGSHNDTWRG
jgi:hypothetical protein